MFQEIIERRLNKKKMFEKLKEKLMKRIENNSVKSELSYKDKDGNTQTEIVYLKRSITPLGDWHRIYLPVNENNKWHIPNIFFGGNKNLIKLILYLILAGIIFIAFRETSMNYQDLMSNSCVVNCITKVLV